MNTKPAGHPIDACIADLLAVLDREIDGLKAAIERLTELRQLVIKQDTESLSRLLARIRNESGGLEDNERRRGLLRRQLAAALEWPVEAVTLTTLAERAEGPLQNDILERKTRLQTLAQTLQKEYTSTRLLLSDCARFNRLLLKSIFEAGRPSGATTYTPAGHTQRQSETVFMNMQL